jgi:hypothetical protein
LEQTIDRGEVRTGGCFDDVGRHTASGRPPGAAFAVRLGEHDRDVAEGVDPAGHAGNVERLERRLDPRRALDRTARGVDHPVTDGRLVDQLVAVQQPNRRGGREV